MIASRIPGQVKASAPSTQAISGLPVRPAHLLSRVVGEAAPAQAEVSSGVVSTGPMSDDGGAVL
jgi:hypothetical protein